MKTKLALTALTMVAISLSGCATKGHVRDQIEALRGDMMRADGDLSTRVDGLDGEVDGAMARAESAENAANGVRDLALGKGGAWREVDRSRVYFAFDSSELDESSQAELDQVASAMESNPHYLVDIFGFADPSGSASYNFILGERRAQAVLRYLYDRVPVTTAGRFQTLSFGEEAPLAEGPTLGEGKERRQVIVRLVERVANQEESLTQN
jgi:peptidoglycan-associated lipoprotein